MAWALWLWLWLALRARGCLHCDPGAARLLEELRGPFLLRQVPRDAELRARVAAVLQRGVLGLAEQPPGARGPAALIGAASPGPSPPSARGEARLGWAERP